MKRNLVFCFAIWAILTLAGCGHRDDKGAQAGLPSAPNGSINGTSLNNPVPAQAVGRQHGNMGVTGKKLDDQTVKTKLIGLWKDKDLNHQTILYFDKGNFSLKSFSDFDQPIFWYTGSYSVKSGDVHVTHVLEKSNKKRILSSPDIHLVYEAQADTLTDKVTPEFTIEYGRITPADSSYAKWMGHMR